MQNIKAIEHSDPNKFENEINQLLQDDYKILSTSCGFANSEQYDFCSFYHAILIKSDSNLNKSEFNSEIRLL